MMTTPSGKPASLAADIIDTRFPWSEPREFYLMLGASALAHELHTGADFGLDAEEITQLHNNMRLRLWTSRTPTLGWDPNHVEPAGFPLHLAEWGKFPSWA